MNKKDNVNRKKRIHYLYTFKKQGRYDEMDYLARVRGRMLG
jgi:hypothetical protein